MEYAWTPQFKAVYEDADGRVIDVVNAVIERLLIDHEEAWARRNRVVGDKGEAWIISTRTANADVDVYWEYLQDEPDSTILLLLLIVAPA